MNQLFLFQPGLSVLLSKTNAHLLTNQIQELIWRLYKKLAKKSQILESFKMNLLAYLSHLGNIWIQRTL